MGRPKARYCRWGHDTQDVGRYPNGTCAACMAARNREYCAEYRARRGATRSDPLTRVYLPSDPLVGWVGERWSRLDDPLRATYLRFRGRHSPRVAVSLVDEVCCALGSHPALVYGPEWWEAS